MKIWKVEVWLQIKDDSPWENWANEHVVADTIQDAIGNAIKKQKEEWKPYVIEVRSATLEIEPTIE